MILLTTVKMYSFIKRNLSDGPLQIPYLTDKCISIVCVLIELIMHNHSAC